MKKNVIDTCKNLVLIGNANVGKTTFFNTLTKSDEHVGNWHGVTVDYKEKFCKFNGEIYKVTDLPGLYSLSTYSYEESVARDYIYSHINNSNNIFISLCDANNLGRNIYLTLQLIENGITPILCINMANELKNGNKKIDVDKLSKLLNIPVLLINAKKRKDLEKVLKVVKTFKSSCSQNLPYFKDIPFANLTNIFVDNLSNLPKLNKEYICIKALEKDEFILEKLNLSREQLNQMYQQKIDETTIAKLRYDYIETLTNACIFQQKDKIYGYSKLDKIVLNKFLALPIFLLVVAVIFFITFSSIGKFLTDILSNFIENYIFVPCLNFLKNHTTNQFIISLVKDGIFAGVGSLISFLPQIALLFLSLSILEESGYMSRLAFTLEDYFAKIGLTGKSVFALLMGFGCSTTSAMTSRNLEDKNSKIKTAMLSPYLSCSAKIPLYTVILSAFFFKSRLLIIILLYFLSVIVAILVSFILEKTILKSGEQSFIMELPPYRFPSFKRILRLLFNNIKSFILRVGTMIVSFSVIIWIFESCNFSLHFDPENSILRTLGTFLAPIFTPLGFGSWGAVVCLICGVVAKEIIVGTMGIINNISTESSMNGLLIGQSLLLSTSNFTLNPCSAISFLVFSLLYMPCISTIAVMHKEIGTKWTLIAILIQFAIAYVLSFVTYKIAINVLINGTISTIISLLIFVAILISLIYLRKYLKAKNKCKFCINYQNCKKSCK